MPKKFQKNGHFTEAQEDDEAETDGDHDAENCKIWDSWIIWGPKNFRKLSAGTLRDSFGTQAGFLYNFESQVERCHTRAQRLRASVSHSNVSTNVGIDAAFKIIQL